MISSARIDNLGSLQPDGRRYVTEIQVDDQKGDLHFLYLAAAGADPNAIMVARTTALDAAASAVPAITVTQDDGTTSSLQTYDLSNLSLQLTAGQKSALQTARTVILAVKPFLRFYQTLTAAQQQTILTHSPWIQQALDVAYGN